MKDCQTRPESYGPLSPLYCGDKLYEHLIRTKLNHATKCTGGLPDNQYAIFWEIEIAKQAAAYSPQHSTLCAIVTLEVKSAFNSVTCQIIFDNFKKWNID